MRAAAVLRILLVLAVLAVPAAFCVTQPMLSKPKAPPERADARRLKFDVYALTHFRGRNTSAPEQLAGAARAIEERWAGEGLPVAHQAWTADGVEVRNLSVHFGPESGEMIVVGAHYDVAGPGAGADDNASGVAGLFELARLLRRNPPKGPVELVAYALEEEPWFGRPEMGSYVHAHALKLDVRRVRGMIALESIGCFSDARGSQKYPSALLRALYPSRGNFVAVAGRPFDYGLVRRVKRAMIDATDLPVRSITAPAAWAGHDRSDNRSYWGEGYRAVMVTDTANHRNPRYHTLEDTADRLDYQRMAQVVTGVFAAVHALSGP